MASKKQMQTKLDSLVHSKWRLEGYVEAAKRELKHSDYNLSECLRKICELREDLKKQNNVPK